MPIDIEIENVPEALIAELRILAAQHQRSLEDEVLAILNEFTREPSLVPFTVQRWEVEMDGLGQPRDEIT